MAGFEGNITGLTTAGTDNSLFGVQVGNPGGQGLKTALTNVNIVDYVGPTKGVAPVITANIAAAAGSAANTIAVGITGALGSTAAASAAQILIENDGPAGTVATPNLTYGTWAVTADSTSLLELRQGGVGGAANLTLGGAGALIAVGQDAVGNWQNLTTLDLSKTTGIAVITGASTGATNALGTGAAGTNPDWLFGSLAGLLNNGATFDLTSVTLGTGKNVIDVSSATAAEVGALKTTGAVVPGNELIVQDSVATTTSATTFANIAGFEVLGIGGPAAAEGASGAIDMKNLPTSIDTIQYTTKAGAGALVITDQSAALTVNVENNSAAANSLTVGDPPGLADNFHFIIGNAAQVAGGAIGDVTLLGDEVVEYTSTGSVGGTTVLNTAGGLLLTPTATGNEVVTIDGDATLHLGFNTGQGAVTDFTGLALNLNNLTVDVTNTAETLWEEGTPGTLLNFKTDTAGNAPVISYSSNAVIIDATKSGGLIDSGFGDANFEHGLTTALSVGDTITGATAPVGATLGGTLAVGDVLGGSIGNDTITSNSTTMPDFIYTEGGTDKITLAGAHTGADHVAFYAGNGFIEAGAAGAVASVAGSIAQNVGNLEFVNPGWWGIGAGGASINIDSLATGTGTSLSESTLTGYLPGQDFLDFSSQAWKGNQVAGGVEGLTFDTGAALGHAVGTPTGVAVSAAQVAPGAALGAGTNFIILSNDTFTGAAQVATDLINGNYNIRHSAATLNTDYNFLLAYQGTDGNAHIADLHIEGAAGSTQTSAGAIQDERVNVSDMVTLVGVTTTQLEANTSHIHLVT